MNTPHTPHPPQNFTSVRVSDSNKSKLNHLARELSVELGKFVSVNEAIAYLLGLKITRA